MAIKTKFLDVLPFSKGRQLRFIFEEAENFESSDVSEPGELINLVQAENYRLDVCHERGSVTIKKLKGEQTLFSQQLKLPLPLETNFDALLAGFYGDKELSSKLSSNVPLTLLEASESKTASVSSDSPQISDSLSSSETPLEAAESESESEKEQPIFLEKRTDVDRLDDERILNLLQRLEHDAKARQHQALTQEKTLHSLYETLKAKFNIN